jgi:hypothetical protein
MWLGRVNEALNVACVMLQLSNFEFRTCFNFLCPTFKATQHDMATAFKARKRKMRGQQVFASKIALWPFAVPMCHFNY